MPTHRQTKLSRPPIDSRVRSDSTQPRPAHAARGTVGVRSIFAITIIAGLTASCTDATLGKLSAYGGSADIKCYSGTKLIYEGTSTGKVQSEASSDGYNFVEKKSGKLKEVSGNCVIEYQKY